MRRLDEFCCGYTRLAAFSIILTALSATTLGYQFFNTRSIDSPLSFDITSEIAKAQVNKLGSMTPKTTAQALARTRLPAPAALSVPPRAQAVGTPGAAQKTQTEAASTSWKEKIDIVIPWSGAAAKIEAGADVARERDNNEMVYLLRSIAKHAPWVRKIWLLVNPSLSGSPVAVPKSLASRTHVLNRCLHMPTGTCPCRSSQAAQAFAHLVPGLAERFIQAEDDIFLGRPVLPTHFYDPSGKPYVWRRKPTWGAFAGKECHRIYEEPSVFAKDLPRSAAPCPHFWYPQLKSACVSTQSRYPEFYAFVGSHISGRYSSRAKGPSDQHNSQEEDPFGWMMCEMLRTKVGVYKNIDRQRGDWWEEVSISEHGFRKAERQRPIFMNVNDHFSKSNGTAYEMQIKIFRNAMGKFFPPEPEIVLDIEPAGTAPTATAQVSESVSRKPASSNP